MTGMFYSYTVCSLWAIAFIVILIMLVCALYVLITFIFHLIMCFKEESLRRVSEYSRIKREVESYEKESGVDKKSRE